MVPLLPQYLCLPNLPRWSDIMRSYHSQSLKKVVYTRVTRTTFQPYAQKIKLKNHCEKVLVFFLKTVSYILRNRTLQHQAKKPIFFLKKLSSSLGNGTFQPQAPKKTKNFFYFSRKKFFPHFKMTADQDLKLEIPPFSRMTNA